LINIFAATFRKLFKYFSGHIICNLQTFSPLEIVCGCVCVCACVCEWVYVCVCGGGGGACMCVCVFSIIPEYSLILFTIYYFQNYASIINTYLQCSKHNSLIFLSKVNLYWQFDILYRNGSREFHWFPEPS